ncbi:hypothetical protein ACPA9J_21365 [Pseudomonas aeruginosa]
MAMQEALRPSRAVSSRCSKKGYFLLNGRLLRPAMVVVSKAAGGTPPSIDDAGLKFDATTSLGSQPSTRPTGGSHGIKVSGE